MEGKVIQYARRDAVQYARQWALSRNRAYNDFTKGGGLQDVYERQERVQRAHDIILKRWPLNARIDEKKKPINGVPELRIVYKKFDIDFDAVEV